LEEVERLSREHPDLHLALRRGSDRVAVPAPLEPLAQSVLAEAVRNAHKHARPTKVEVALERHDGTLFLDVTNDGVGGRPKTTGMGLKLAALEALQAGGVGGTSDRRLRVLVVDDHEVVHWGLRLMLGEQPWVERCLSARNTKEALAMTKRYEPHVALVDLFVGQESGATICERLREVVPPPNVLMISGAGRISPNAARAAGAAGFISKDWPAADIAGAVRMVGLGMTVFKPHEAPAGPPLTDREREVLEAVAGGATNREIAERLFLSPHTVKEHTSSLYRKLGARNRAEAVQKAQRIGLIS
jgi:two-component system response regulator DesR